MKKFLKTKLALSLALALTMGSFLSVSTSPVMAQDIIAEEIAYTDEEMALLVTSALRAAWRTTSVRNLAYSVAAGVVAGVVEVVSGFEVASAEIYPGDALD